MSEAAGGTSSPFHFHSAEMREAEHAFRRAYPAFASTASLDALRAKEYRRGGTSVVSGLGPHLSPRRVVILPLAILYFLFLAGMVVSYLFLVELVKRRLMRRYA